MRQFTKFKLPTNVVPSDFRMELIVTAPLSINFNKTKVEYKFVVVDVMILDVADAFVYRLEGNFYSLVVYMF